MRLENKEQVSHKNMLQGVLKHSTTVSWWEVAMKGDCRVGEGLTWFYREAQAADSSNSEE
jgi:hypothetical protein